MADQPPPIPTDGPPIWDLVIDDPRIRARKDAELAILAGQAP